MSHVVNDRKQKFWVLAAIQASAMGLPVMLVGGKVAKTYGVVNAIFSVIIGNLILWLLSLCLISMSSFKRFNAIENIKNYLGKIGSNAAASILIVAFMLWFSLQLDSAVHSLEVVYPSMLRGQVVSIIGACIGITVSIVSMGGIKSIKLICIASLPYLFIFSLFVLLYSPAVAPVPQSKSFSFFSIVYVVMTFFPGRVNIPTFFRHSRSRADSIMGLAVMTALVCFFESFTIYYGLSTPEELFLNLTSKSSSSIVLFFVTIYILLSVLCINLANIYYASAIWEAISPSAHINFWYLSIGILGTVAFVLSPLDSRIVFLEQLTTNLIGSLGMILLFAFLIRIVVQHRPRKHEQYINLICWVVGAVSSLITQSTSNHAEVLSFLVGIGMTTFSFVLIIFLEETVWSVKSIILKRKTKYFL